MTEECRTNERTNEDIVHYTNTLYCSFCGQEATQKHHVKYDPEMVIPICVPCHVKLHEHGVGNGSSSIVHEILIQEEEPTHPPHFLKTIDREGVPYIVTKTDEEVVANLICANGCKMGWQLLYSQQINTFFLRCPNCGYDVIIADADQLLRSRLENAKTR